MGRTKNIKRNYARKIIFFDENSCLLTISLSVYAWQRLNMRYRADIQRHGSILAWIVILSFYGADTIAIDLSLSALIS
jgi:hypothetical protein